MRVQKVTSNLPTVRCWTCGQRFPKYNNRVYCSPHCLRVKAPAVYRFVCPDGRSYVGSALDIRKRDDRGICRKNERLTKAFKKHPPETWRFEILETLPPACAVEILRAAEQRHIDRLRTYRESKGFNIVPALWAGNGPAQKAGRRYWRTLYVTENQNAAPV